MIKRLKERFSLNTVLSVAVLFGAALLAVVLICSPALTASKAPAGETVLYDKQVADMNINEIEREWQTNTKRCWLLSGEIDGEKQIKYYSWSGVYANDDIGKTENKTGLSDGATLKITISGLSINTARYDDIRLNIDYLSNVSYSGLTHTDAL